MRRSVFLIVIAMPLLGLLLLGAVALANPRWLVMQGRHLGGAATPEVAVRSMLQVEANGLRDFRVVADEWAGLQRLVVFTYAVQPPGQPFHNEFGFAVVEMRQGWSASPGPLHADAPAPHLVTYGSAALGGGTLVYGKVLDDRISTVEAIFDGGVERTRPHNGGFLLLERRGRRFSELRALDATGQVLQHSVLPELAAPAHWQ